jgi:hypothetical protein
MCKDTLDYCPRGDQVHWPLGTTEPHRTLDCCEREGRPANRDQDVLGAGVHLPEDIDGFIPDDFARKIERGLAFRLERLSSSCVAANVQLDLHPQLAQASPYRRLKRRARLSQYGFDESVRTWVAPGLLQLACRLLARETP